MLASIVAFSFISFVDQLSLPVHLDNINHVVTSRDTAYSSLDTYMLLAFSHANVHITSLRACMGSSPLLGWDFFCIQVIQ